MLVARTPEAPEQTAGEYIPMTWGSGSQPYFHRAHYGPSARITGMLLKYYVINTNQPDL